MSLSLLAREESCHTNGTFGSRALLLAWCSCVRDRMSIFWRSNVSLWEQNAHFKGQNQSCHWLFLESFHLPSFSHSLTWVGSAWSQLSVCLQESGWSDHPAVCCCQGQLNKQFFQQILYSEWCHVHSLVPRLSLGTKLPCTYVHRKLENYHTTETFH